MKNLTVKFFVILAILSVVVIYSDVSGNIKIAGMVSIVITGVLYVLALVGTGKNENPSSKEDIISTEGQAAASDNHAEKKEFYNDLANLFFIGVAAGLSVIFALRHEDLNLLLITGLLLLRWMPMLSDFIKKINA
jgi:hypothetical protein